MDEDYFYYEKNFTSRDVKVVLNSNKIIEGYLNATIPADENDSNQVLLLIHVGGGNHHVEVLVGDIKKIEVIEE